MQGEGLSFLVLGVPSNMSSVPKPCWYRLAPGHLVLLLLAVEGFLWLSEHFRWFAFNQHKGWTVLIAVAIVGAVILLMIIWFLLSLILRLRFQYRIRSLLAHGRGRGNSVRLADGGSEGGQGAESGGGGD